MTEPGLHFKLPWPIQSVETLSKETFSLQFGYEEKDGKVKEFPEETKMITGDENIVLADLVVQWKITDPAKYLFNAEHPEEILFNSTSASLRSIIGSSKIDDALTSGKAEIEADVRDLLSTLVEKYDIGISILAVKLQDVELPNDEVRKAFTNVTDARETMNTKINEAGKYRNKRTNEAKGEEAAIKSKAQGDKAARIETARGDVSVFNKLYEEYRTNPDITRERLMLETLEQVLPNAEIYIMNDNGDTLKYFPIRPLENQQPKTNAEEVKKMSNDNVVNIDGRGPKGTNWKNYTKIGSIFVIVIILLAVFISNLIVVKEGQYKVIRQFGEVVRIVKTPGLTYKIPFIQSVTTLPKFQMTYDVTEAEINTKDKKRMLIDNYAIWRIEDPKKMITNARTVEKAESRMEEFIYSVVRSELGQLNYDEIINDEKSSRGSLNDRITEKVNDLLGNDNYGIVVTDVRMKRTDLPSENEQSVFTRMISERESKAQEYLSMGDAEKNRIEADTDREVQELLAKAKAEAESIRADGEAEAARIYNESFSKDPTFYSMYRTLESYKKTINDKSVIVLPSDSPYARLLMGYTD